jgi:hypothetical protein
VEGAVFCHRCGKPARELLPEEVPLEAVAAAPSEAAPVPLPQPKTMPVSFHNIVAVRIGLLVASVASMLDALPFIDTLFVVWSAGAGFAAVWLYRRSTGQSLSVRGGAKLGWITGVLNSVIVMVLLTLTFVASASEVSAFLHQQFKATAAQDPARYAQAMAFFDSPYAIVLAVLMFGLMVFIVFTGACVAGGALGARFTRKISPPA